MDVVEISNQASGCIYVLLDSSKRVIYVGQTTNPQDRFVSHRSILGPAIEMKIVQDRFENVETLSDAEGKWIRYYKRQGANLLNKQGIIPYPGRRRPGKDRHRKELRVFITDDRHLAYACKKCGHEWVRRTMNKLPRWCPKCHTEHWDDGNVRPWPKETSEK
jgi:predicted GIY-YIG superfamily endonuclease/ribosomal protein L37AE/L43A